MSTRFVFYFMFVTACADKSFAHQACAPVVGGYSVAFLYWVVIIPTMNSKQVIKQLESGGWTLRSVRGCHHVFTHPSKPGHISVPHPKQDLGVGLVHKLLKQAGLK